VDRDEDGRFQFDVLPGQTAVNVLQNLGYHDFDATTLV
jgi:hypothetical protein